MSVKNIDVLPVEPSGTMGHNRELEKEKGCEAETIEGRREGLFRRCCCRLEPSCHLTPHKKVEQGCSNSHTPQH